MPTGKASKLALFDQTGLIQLSVPGPTDIEPADTDAP